MSNMENDTNADFSTMGNPLYSIAISLKRIADKLELASKQPIIMSADEYSKYMEAKEMRDEARKAIQENYINTLKFTG